MLNEQRLIVSRNKPTVLCASARATFQARHQTLPAKRPGAQRRAHLLIRLPHWRVQRDTPANMNVELHSG